MRGRANCSRAPITSPDASRYRNTSKSMSESAARATASGPSSSPSTSSAATSAARICSATAETSASAVTVTCGPIPGARCSILRRNWQSTSFGRSCGTRPTTRANSAE
ncbi:hypothetical protein A5N77_00540 [Prescottella equi]|nr:hypothetical protein A6F56_22740 [Prescottella equi]ORL04271.1 hypothetical protein A6I84_22105 [Prescottella equi]ORL71660.1 hypothetical protein A5N75_22315 [Prescottella equi]ORL86361.1 hypothetical protein A5N76_22420 [Prescottella equi]ORM13624.1 hypothetical protein A5N77_00540 [Prescottella equi]